MAPTGRSAWSGSCNPTLPLLIVAAARFGVFRTVGAVVVVTIIYRLALFAAMQSGALDADGVWGTVVLPNFFLGRWSEFALGMVAAELYRRDGLPSTGGSSLSPPWLPSWLWLLLASGQPRPVRSRVLHRHQPRPGRQQPGCQAVLLAPTRGHRRHVVLAVPRAPTADRGLCRRVRRWCGDRSPHGLPATDGHGAADAGCRTAPIALVGRRSLFTPGQEPVSVGRLLLPPGTTRLGRARTPV